MVGAGDFARAASIAASACAWRAAIALCSSLLVVCPARADCRAVQRRRQCHRHGCQPAGLCRGVPIGRRAANHCLGALRGYKLTTAPMLIHTPVVLGHRPGPGRLAGLSATPTGRLDPAAGRGRLWPRSPSACWWPPCCCWPCCGMKAGAPAEPRLNPGWNPARQRGNDGFSAVLKPLSVATLAAFPLSLAGKKGVGSGSPRPKSTPQPYCAQRSQHCPAKSCHPLPPPTSPHRPQHLRPGRPPVGWPPSATKRNCPPCWLTTIFRLWPPAAGRRQLLLTHRGQLACVRIATRASACWPTMANRCRWRQLRANPGMVLFATPATRLVWPGKPVADSRHGGRQPDSEHRRLWRGSQRPPAQPACAVAGRRPDA